MVDMPTLITAMRSHTPAVDPVVRRVMSIASNHHSKAASRGA
jgi:hypothetical protein